MFPVLDDRAGSGLGSKSYNPYIRQTGLHHDGDEDLSEQDPDHPGDHGVAVEEAAPKTRVPPLFQVVLLNDDYTPMEFVVDVLERFFALNRSNATRVMLEVHTRGKGVCGVFTYEIAETKVSQVTTYSRENQHPLMCTLEQA